MAKVDRHQEAEDTKGQMSPMGRTLPNAEPRGHVAVLGVGRQTPEERIHD